MKLRNYGENLSDSDLIGWQRKKMYDAKQRALDVRVYDKEISDLLDSIDIDDVNAILLSEVIKSGSSTDGDESMTRKDFLLEKAPKDCHDNAVHDTFERLVHIYPENLRANALKSGISLKAATLRIVCHELGHDYSKMDVEGSDVTKFYPAKNISFLKTLFLRVESRPAQKSIIKRGYGKTESTKPAINADEPYDSSQIRHEQDFNVDIDEGITEKSAIDTMQAYLKKHKDFLTAEEQKQLFSALTDTEKGAYYSRQVAMVEELISHLSEASEIFGRDQIWLAIKRGKFGKENVNDPETLATLKEALSPEIFNRFFYRQTK